MKFGICYRPNLHSKFLEDIISNIDLLEIMPEVTSVKEMKKIKKISKLHNISLGLHCLKSSLFSPEGPQLKELEKYFYIFEYLNAIYYSDHIAVSHINGKYLTTVNPIEYNQKYINVFKNNLNSLKDFFAPEDILIENITQNKLIEAEYSESQFIDKIFNQTNISCLLDITNQYVTAKRNNISFEKYIKNYPFDSVKVVHVSGFLIDEMGIYRDTHSKDLSNEILEVVSFLAPKLSNAQYILVERDFNVNCPEDIVRDLNALKSIF